MRNHFWMSNNFYHFRVFKKASPSNKITTYLGKRDFLDRGDHVDLIGLIKKLKLKGIINLFVDGMVLVNDEYIASGKKITVQLLAAFRYGREDLDGTFFQFIIVHHSSTFGF